MTEQGSPPILEVRELRKRFTSRSSVNPLRSLVVPAVDGVSFQVGHGRTVALVGESGSGKSTLARLILHLERPDAGEILLNGIPVHDLSSAAFRRHRRRVQMVFQSPLSSFDPLYTIGRSIKEVLRLREPAEPDGEVARLLGEVGLSPRFAGLHPRDVSGGELQRAAIARAVAAYPDLVVLDEPTSALDVSIQGQVLSLLKDLQRTRGLSYLLATHDLRVVSMVAHDVIVLYLGQIMEQAAAAELFQRPLHPYTLGLLQARELGRRADGEKPLRIRGALRYPDPSYTGCRLVGRCPLAAERCREPQSLTPVRPDHVVRCWRAAAGETAGLVPHHRTDTTLPAQ